MLHCLTLKWAFYFYLLLTRTPLIVIWWEGVEKEFPSTMIDSPFHNKNIKKTYVIKPYGLICFLKCIHKTELDVTQFVDVCCEVIFIRNQMNNTARTKTVRTTLQIILREWSSILLSFFLFAFIDYKIILRKLGEELDYN